MSKISIEQWRVFTTIVDEGGFSQAGEALFKTQSTISHSVKKLESTLGKSLFLVSGRKAELTDFGHSLLSSARALVQHAETLEQDAISSPLVARQFLRIAIDVLFPRPLLYRAIAQFTDEFNHVNVDIHQTCLSRTGELLEDGAVSLGIANSIPKGFLPKHMLDVTLVAVAHSASTLCQTATVSLQDLAGFRQIVIRDSGMRHSVNSGWLGAADRVTVSNIKEMYHALCLNIGFAWVPEWFMAQQSGPLQRLALGESSTRTVSLLWGISPDLDSDELPHKLMQYLTGALSSAA